MAVTTAGAGAAEYTHPTPGSSRSFPPPEAEAAVEATTGAAARRGNSGDVGHAPRRRRPAAWSELVRLAAAAEVPPAGVVRGRHARRVPQPSRRQTGTHGQRHARRPPPGRRTAARRGSRRSA
uniref:Uncharacterized protein n=1 Tax=Oryza glaberrima TaxID=4538 RepID=I1P429_ORYGL